MSVICAHCQGGHFSNRCPVFPQLCTTCYEEHPFGVKCYSGWRAPDEDTSEIDRQIALEEAEKARQREGEKKSEDLRKAEIREKERIRKAKYREKNREAYNLYMRENYLRWKK